MSAMSSAGQTAMSAGAPDLETPDVGAAEASAAAGGGELECLARRQSVRSTGAEAGEKERLFQLREEVASLVRGDAVDAEPDGSPSVEEVAYRAQPRRQPSIRARAVGHAGTGCPYPDNLRRVEMDGVCIPHVAVQPSEIVDNIERASAKARQAIAFLRDRLGEVSMQPQAKPAGKRR